MGGEPQSMRHSPEVSTGVVTQSAHPATVFLSYKREDAEEISLLQRYLMLRGIHAWRDATNLELGRYTRDEIARFIEDEADAFLLYLTPQCLKSNFIWMEEVPAALRRWERDQHFTIIPVFRGVSIQEFQLFCADRGYSRLYEFAGVVLPKGPAEESETGVAAALQQVAQRTLRAALKQRFRRVQAGADYEPWVAVHTYPFVPSTGTLDLDLDWTARYDGQLPDQEEWQTWLLPALQEVKDVLSETTPSRALHLSVQAHLSAALALGAAFPATSHFTLWVEGQHGTWRSEPLTAATGTLLPRKQYKLGTGTGAIVEVAISRDTTQAISNALQHLGLDYRYRIRLGTGNHVVGNAAMAASMAAQVGAELRRLRDRLVVPKIHLFLSTPAALAVLIGNQLNAVGPICVYEHQKSANTYALAFTLGRA